MTRRDVWEYQTSEQKQMGKKVTAFQWAKGREVDPEDHAVVTG